MLCRESAKNHRREKKIERYQQDSFIPTAWCDAIIHNEAGAHRQVLNLDHLALKRLIVKVALVYKEIRWSGVTGISALIMSLPGLLNKSDALHFTALL